MLRSVGYKCNLCPHVYITIMILRYTHHLDFLVFLGFLRSPPHLSIVSQMHTYLINVLANIMYIYLIYTGILCFHMRCLIFNTLFNTTYNVTLEFAVLYDTAIVSSWVVTTIYYTLVIMASSHFL